MNKIVQFLLISGCVAIPLFMLTATKQAPQTEKTDKKAQKYAATITGESLKNILSILAHDSLAGRATEDASYLRAAAFIQRNLTAAGIGSAPAQGKWEGGYYHQVPLQGTTWETFTIAANGKTLNFPTDFFMDKGTTRFIAKKGFSGNLVIAKGSAGSDSSVKGKVVILLAPSEQELNAVPAIEREGLAYTFARTYTSLGARLVIVEQLEFSRFAREAQATRMRAPFVLASDKEETKGNSFAVVYAPTKQILALTNLTTESLDQFRNSTNNQWDQPKMSIAVKAIPKDTLIYRPNVLGFIPGKNTKETVFLSAHLDHLGFTGGGICNGADDDGSGSAALLNIALTFQKAVKEGWQPKRNIAFIWFTGEERGLLGSKYYAENPAIPMNETVTDLNIDMIGRNDEAHAEASKRPFIYVIGSNMLSPELHTLHEEIAKLYSPVQLDYTYADPEDKNRFYYRSDHYNFAKNGVPVIFYFNGVHDNYHQPSDEVPLIDFTSYAQRAQLAFYTAWHLAVRDKRVLVK
jgi:hypothetical protein